MPHAADPHKADRDRASEPAGAVDAGGGVWVKRWSLSVPSAGPVPLATELTEPGPEDRAGSPAPPTGIERELRAIRSAIDDLRREVRELRAGRDDSD